MHGVAPHMCDQDVRPLLDQGAGGRSPGYLLLAMAPGGPAYSLQKSLNRIGARTRQTAVLVIEQRFRTAQSGSLPRHGSPHEATRPARLCFPRKAAASPNKRS